MRNDLLVCRVCIFIRLLNLFYRIQFYDLTYFFIKLGNVQFLVFTWFIDKVDFIIFF